ncbi:MAG TPA: malto-oligosyltrehalose trehalohydrolase [Gemmataceae bacterium]|nr:malto-oligosyltrehalose trehalohydrolase [Gemmataceae bacterium]
MHDAESPRCGAFSQPDGAVRWRVWAPRAGRVELVLIDGHSRRHPPMEPEPGGFFRYDASGISEGQRYAFRLNNGPERPDPMTLWQPDGVHQPSAVLFPERFAWDERGWTGLPRRDLVLYELHVGTFTPEGTFDAVVSRLDALKDLGATAIEIMPVAQFPGPRNWGYDGVHPFAPQNSYGGPHGLQRLVNACHTRGLAVLLDVVYNHLGPEGNYLHEFGPYFTDRCRTPWGPAFNCDDFGCDPVREWILANVRLWIGQYRMDGLRLDATHAIFDQGPRHILREIKEAADTAARALGRPAHIIAEHLRNDPRLLQSPERGGYGLDAEWNDDFHHAVHAFLTGERQGYYVDFGEPRDFPKLCENTFLLDGVYSQFRGRRFGAPAGDLTGDRFVVSIQTHDQVGNRAGSERLASLIPPSKLRLAASLLLLAPHLPMLFMGEEYGEDRPFWFFCSFLDRRLVEAVRSGRQREYAALLAGAKIADPQAEATFAACRLSWSWPEGTPRAGLRRLYRDLLTARRRWPALRDFAHRRARLLPDSSEPNVLHMIRGGEREEELHVYFNLTDRVQPLDDGGRRRLFRSEAERYGGVNDAEGMQELRPYECVALGAHELESADAAASFASNSACPG